MEAQLRKSLRASPVPTSLTPRERYGIESGTSMPSIPDVQKIAVIIPMFVPNPWPAATDSSLATTLKELYFC